MDLKVDQTMARDLVQHVVQKGHPSVEDLFASAVEIDREAEARFIGIADNFCGTHDMYSDVLRS